MPDYAAELVEISTAISAILTGAQSYSIAGRSLTRADLATLYKRQQWLVAQTARAARSGGIRVRGGTPV